MDERQKLLKRIQMYDFAITEAVEFLDGHPTDAAALAYYQKYRKMRAEAMDTYESTYGPLTIFGNNSTTEWKWSTTAWPWEMEE